MVLRRAGRAGLENRSLDADFFEVLLKDLPDGLCGRMLALRYTPGQAHRQLGEDPDLHATLHCKLSREQHGMATTLLWTRTASDLWHVRGMVGRLCWYAISEAAAAAKGDSTGWRVLISMPGFRSSKGI